MAVVDQQFRYLSVTEAAANLGLTVGRIRQLLISGELKGHKLGWSWAIPASEIEQFKANREKKRRVVKTG